MQTVPSRTLLANAAHHRSALSALGLARPESGRNFRGNRRGVPKGIGISCPSRRFLEDQARPQMLVATVQHQQTDRAPLDAWWAIEDLWRRIRQHLAVEVHFDEGGDSQLSFHHFRHWVGAGASELRHRLFDTELYAWQVRQSGESGNDRVTRGSLVRLLDYEGDSLMLTLTPYRQIARGPQGDEVSCLIKALMIEWRMRLNSSAH